MEGGTISFVGDGDGVLGFFVDLVCVVFDCFLNCLDDDGFELLAACLEGEELFVELILLVDGTVQFMSDLAVQDIRIVVIVQTLGVRLGNRNPFPQRLRRIALLISPHTQSLIAMGEFHGLWGVQIYPSVFRLFCFPGRPPCRDP